MWEFIIHTMWLELALQSTVLRTGIVTEKGIENCFLCAVLATFLLCCTILKALHTLPVSYTSMTACTPMKACSSAFLCIIYLGSSHFLGIMLVFRKNEVRVGVKVLSSPVSTNHTSWTSSKQLWCHWITTAWTSQSGLTEVLIPITSVMPLFTYLQMKWSKKKGDTKWKKTQQKDLERQSKAPPLHLCDPVSVWVSWRMNTKQYDRLRTLTQITREGMGRNGGGGGGWGL